MGARATLSTHMKKKLTALKVRSQLLCVRRGGGWRDVSHVSSVQKVEPRTPSHAKTSPPSDPSQLQSSHLHHRSLRLWRTGSNSRGSNLPPGAVTWKRTSGSWSSPCPPAPSSTGVQACASCRPSRRRCWPPPRMGRWCREEAAPAPAARPAARGGRS